jgi:hypothetical protein
MITAARLRRLLDYSKKTGIFRWRKSPALSVLPAQSLARSTTLDIESSEYRAGAIRRAV